MAVLVVPNGPDWLMVLICTAFYKNDPIGISGCRKKRLNDSTFFLTTAIKTAPQFIN